jgi:hypothetical protein
LPPLEGVVDYVSPDCLGVRTADALYRFLRGFYGSGVVMTHHLFATSLDRARVARAWQDWLSGLFT